MKIRKINDDKQAKYKIIKISSIKEKKLKKKLVFLYKKKHKKLQFCHHSKYNIKLAKFTIILFPYENSFFLLVYV